MSNSIVVDDELVEDTSVDEAGIEGTIPQEEGEATPNDSFSMPEKFTGKSAEEIAQSYAEVEKELGRKNNEVGELRKLTDEYIHQELSRRTIDDPKKESATPLEFDDFVENPGAAISSEVDRRMKEVDKRFAEQDQAMKVEKFLGANPDYQKVSESQEFYNWANASPYRVNQLNAAQAGDLDAAGDILQGYRDQSGALQDAAKEGEKVKRKKALKDASTETAGTGDTTGKVYKKADLRRMYVHNQEEYNRQLPDIEKAYREGRVK